jgi:hypothetical protein
MSKTPEYFDPSGSLVIPAGIFVREDTGEEDEDDEEEQPRKHPEDEDSDEDEGYSP